MSNSRYDEARLYLYIYFTLMLCQYMCFKLNIYIVFHFAFSCVVQHHRISLYKCMVLYIHWPLQAVTLLEDQGSADGAVLDAFLSLARYADGQYQHIIEYTRSGSFEAKQALIRQAKEEADQLKSVGEKTRWVDSGQWIRSPSKVNAWPE